MIAIAAAVVVLPCAYWLVYRWLTREKELARRQRHDLTPGWYRSHRRGL